MTSTSSSNKSSFVSFLPFLLLISFVSLLNNLARTIFSPLVPYICTEMNLCHADTGNLFLVLSIGFAITLFSSQFISAKISYKMTILISILTTGFSLLFTAYASSFTSLRLSLFLIGLSSGLFIPSAVAMIREFVDTNHLGKAFGIFASAQSIAFILSPFLVQSYIKLFTWHQILSGLGITFSLATFFLLFLLKGGAHKGAFITLSFARAVLSTPAFWIILGLLCLANGLNVGIYNMAPDYFQCHNLLEGNAVNRLIGLARILSIITVVLVGVLADCFGLKHSITLALILCGILTISMGIVAPSSSLALFCLQSPIASCLKPLTHFAMATIIPAEKNAALVSFMAPFAFMAGAGIVPQILGFFGDSNLYAEGFIIFGATAILGGVGFNVNRVYHHIESSQKKDLEME